MIAHSLYHRSLRKNKRGYSAIIGTVIMVLIILFLYSNMITFSLKRDIDFQNIISRSQQLDADRNAEQVTITNVVITQGSQTGQLIITCTLTNTGPVPVQIARLWLQDKNLTQNNSGNIGLSTPPLTLQPGSRIQKTFPPITIIGASIADSFHLWLVTFRGNSFAKTIN